MTFKLVLWNQLVRDSAGLLQNIFGQLIIHLFYKFVLFPYFKRSYSRLPLYVVRDQQPIIEGYWLKNFKCSALLALSSEVLAHTGSFLKMQGVLAPGFCWITNRVVLECLEPLCLWHKMSQMRLLVKPLRCPWDSTDIFLIWKAVVGKKRHKKKLSCQDIGILVCTKWRRKKKSWTMKQN